jgi:hypothetical protein
LQEQIDREAIAITVKASKLTGRVLAKAFMAALRQAQKAHRAAQTPKGRQPVKKLMNHNEATSTIPLDGETKLFDRIARKFKVDYSFHKTGRGKYLLLFKAKQTDAVTAAFSEYTKAYMKRAKDKRPPIMEQLKKAAELARQQKSKQKEHTRKREVARE